MSFQAGRDLDASSRNGFGAGNRDGMIIFHRAARDADGTDYLAGGVLDRHTTGKSDQAAVRDFDL